MRLVDTFIIAIYGAMNYPLLMPNLVAFLCTNECNIKIEFHDALEVSAIAEPGPRFAMWKNSVLEKLYSNHIQDHRFCMILPRIFMQL